MDTIENYKYFFFFQNFGNRYCRVFDRSFRWLIIVSDMARPVASFARETLERFQRLKHGLVLILIFAMSRRRQRMLNPYGSAASNKRGNYVANYCCRGAFRPNPVRRIARAERYTMFRPNWIGSRTNWAAKADPVTARIGIGRF